MDYGDSQKMILQIALKFTLYCYVQADSQNLPETALFQILVLFKTTNYFLYILWVGIIFKTHLLNIHSPSPHAPLPFSQSAWWGFKRVLPHLIITQLAKQEPRH